MTSPEPTPQHTDDPTRSISVEGRTVSNLTMEEYNVTYAQGTPCSPIPADILAALYEKLGHTIPGPA